MTWSCRRTCNKSWAEAMRQSAELAANKLIYLWCEIDDRISDIGMSGNSLALDMWKPCLYMQSCA